MTSSNNENADHRGSQWSSRSVGMLWQHRFFYLLIRLGGRRAAYFALYFVALYYMLLRPDQRKKSEYYLRRRFSGSSRLSLWTKSYLMSLELGKVLVDRAAVGILGADAVTIDVQGKDRLHELVREGKGLILITAHVGCWQVAMTTLKFLNLPAHLLMQREEGDVDRHFFEHAGENSSFRIIDPRGYLGGSLEMMAVLKKGEILSVMGDRMLGSEKSSVTVQFLGGKIRVPYSAYMIASATKAPIAVLLSRRTGLSGYQLELAGVIRVPGDLGRKNSAYLPYAQEFIKILEEYTERSPFQFFNFYDMWNSGSND
ncbi:lipid A biosynthesis acyltransferase [bacterium]|nr:MAG: lipid A biosynthesis acyltransferase [bacterium]